VVTTSDDAQAQAHFHERIDPHRGGSRLSEVILGGQDGLVNVLGVVLGVAAATREPRVVLAAGLAATFAESFSMAAVAYTSKEAERALYESERAREHRHVARVPELERDEVRAIFRKKGLEGPLLDEIVRVVTADPEAWVELMMAEEHRLPPVRRGRALRAALVVGVAALVGSLLPLAPFLVMPVGVASVSAVVVAALTLFGVGVYKAATTVGSALRSGLEMAAIGTATALVGWIVGLLFRAAPTG
jgi:VIT1/CCC1 family predicted Fe2+/Mn2+ transporter